MRRKLADAGEGGSRHAEHPPIPPDARATLKLLIVEDDRTLREGLVVTLRADGFTVSSAASGAEALAELERSRYDIVITDLHLQPVTGADVLRAARRAQPHVVVVVITGDPSLPGCLEVIRAGAWDCLPKPFSAAHLRDLLARAVHVVLQANGSARAGTLAVTQDDEPSRRERMITEFERAYLGRLMRDVGRNRKRAARLARIDTTTLHQLLEKHALE
ncbi:MAG TPA: response regulator [Gemmatimonadaceae bacterium]|nr:response regulator [Gemmatimonadaceae bacterium]